MTILHAVGGPGPAPAQAPSPAAARWFPGTDLPSRAPLRLICFPYAGGTPSAFRRWPAALGPGAQVIGVLYPGRGTRLGEEPRRELGPLVAEIADALIECGLARDYLTFGHSMGALVAYEVSCELRRRGQPGPLHAFVSASRAPQLYGGETSHALPDDELWRLIRGLGGVPGGDTLPDSYLTRRLPVLRADLSACERYRWQPRPPLDCPMTAFCATDDPIAGAGQVAAWRACTSRSFVQHTVPGDHFFVTTAPQPLLRQLGDELRPLRSRHPFTPAADPSTTTIPDPRRTPSWLSA
ncbi:MAG TPA: thioesterase domain-containing protein [Streptosporangiaceae bacterium]|jgi:surfactin synthase thioesterase subunit